MTDQNNRRWLAAATGRLAAELDPGATAENICIVAEDHGQVVAYTLTRGHNEIQRRIITDLEALATESAAASIDATPEDASHA